MRKYGTYLLTSCLGSKSKWKMSKIGHTFGKKSVKNWRYQNIFIKKCTPKLLLFKKTNKKNTVGSVRFNLEFFHKHLKNILLKKLTVGKAKKALWSPCPIIFPTFLHWSVVIFGSMADSIISKLSINITTKAGISYFGIIS